MPLIFFLKGGGGGRKKSSFFTAVTAPLRSQLARSLKVQLTLRNNKIKILFIEFGMLQSNLCTAERAGHDAQQWLSVTFAPKSISEKQQRQSIMDPNCAFCSQQPMSYFFVLENTELYIYHFKCLLFILVQLNAFFSLKVYLLLILTTKAKRCECLC